MAKTVLIISHTHWDRVWYRTLQEFRLELVKMMDSLLELLSSNREFKVFHLDGQTAMIEDYLSLRPERRETVGELIQSGRLKVGPWYLQPDNFIVSGEALVRNLLKGTRMAASFGDSRWTGWLPDSFGHPAQLPQILRSFGITSFIFSRGLGDHLNREAMEFIWESPHGDEVFALLQYGGYYSGSNLAYPFFWGNIQITDPDHELAAQKLRSLIAKSERLSSADVIPIWNGSDHMYPERTLSETLTHVNSRIDEYDIIQGSVDEYLTAVRRNAEALQRVSGELRGGRYEAILSSVLSTRMHIKQKNAEIERLLERSAEPLLVLAGLLGYAYPGYAVNDAWSALLENHFHDAICGCGIDQVHREMECSFAKAEQTARMLIHDSLNYIRSVIAPEEYRGVKGELAHLMLYSGIAHPLNKPLSAVIDVPAWDGDCSIRMLDSGEEHAVQVLKREVVRDQWIPREAAAGLIIREMFWWQEYLRYVENRCIADFSIDESGSRPLLILRCGDSAFENEEVIRDILSQMRLRPESLLFTIEAYYLQLHLVMPAALPASGYAAAVLCSPRQMSEESDSTDEADAAALTVGDRFLENSFIRVETDAEGRISILHKESGMRYADVHRFQDQADRGDTYDFCPVSHEDVLNTVLEPVEFQVTAVERGPVRGCLQLRYVFEIPAGLDADDRNLRSREIRSVGFVTRIYVQRGLGYVEFETEVNNTADDHRLRMYARAPFRSSRMLSDGQFYIAERPVAHERRSSWLVQPPEVSPHERWVACSDGTNGLAVLSEGLPEHSAVVHDDGMSIALTLLRCVGWLSRHDNLVRPGQGGPPIPTPDAQCRGIYRFRYAIYPFSGDVIPGHMMEVSRQFDSEPLIKLLPCRPKGFPDRLSLLEIAPNALVMTAFKRSEDGRYMVVRFYNAAGDRVRAKISGALTADAAWKARADETPLELLSDRRGRLELSFDVEAYEICTLLIAAELAPGDLLLDSY